MTDAPLVLIVDDNPALQQATAWVLRQAGYRTCTADDGRAALRVARSEKPDLILPDVMLPDLSGLAVCRQIKADPALTGCFVVMLSSLAIDSSSQIEGLESGADGYIARPIPSGELAARVRGLLRIKLAEDRLRESEERYRTLIEQASDGIFVADAGGRCVEVNSMGCALLGYTRAEILHKSIQDLAPQDELSIRPFTPADFQGGQVVRSERHLLRRDGSRLPVEISARILADGRWQAIVRDITERRRTEEVMRRVSRLYAVLSQVNQTIVRVKEQAELFEAICRIAVEFGQFRMAWIGLIDAPTGRVQPIVHCGCEEGYLQNININLDAASPFSQGPSGQAILQGKIVASEDIETAPHMLPWRDEALKRGYRSSAAAPFHLKGNVIGVFTLYASEPGFFSEAEQKLLEEIGLDISFALDAMAAQAEREQAEAQREAAIEALRESEERYRNIFNNSIEGIFQTTPAGRYRTINPAFARMFGYESPEEMITAITNIGEQLYVHPADRERLIVLMSAADGMVRDFEAQLIRKDRSLFWVSINARLIRQDEGQAPYIEGACMDITERKQAEFQREAAIEALRQSEAQYRQIVDTALEGIWAMDGARRTTFVNTHLAAMLSYPPQEMLGRPVEHFMFEEDLGDHAQRMQHRCQGQGDQYERRFRSKDGREVWTIVSATALMNSEGRFAGSFAMFTDITERKRAESQREAALEALRYERDFAESLIETAQTVVLVLDTQGRIVRFNPYMEEISGYALAEVQGKDWFTTFVPERDREPVRRLFLNAIGDIQTRGNVNPIVTKDGRERQLEWYDKTLKDAQGHVAGLLSIAQDVTERKRAEEALVLANERLTLAQRSANAGVWDWDMLTGQLNWSPELYPLFGLNPAEADATFEVWRNVIHPADRQTAEDRINEAIRNHAPLVSEYRILMLSGETRWITALGNALYDEQGKARRMSGICLDITERKQAEEVLHQQNQYLRALQETALDLISQLDLDELLENIVKRAGQLLGTNSGSLDLAEPDTGQFNPKVGLGALAESLQHTVQLGEGMVGVVWQTGQPVVIDDYDAWANRIGSFSQHTLGAVIGVPLLSGAQVQGVLGVAHEAGTNRTFGPEAVEILTQFARLATVAIENARLFAVAQQELAERKQAEQQIESLARFPAENPNPILRLRPDGVILYANEASRVFLQEWGCAVDDNTPPVWRTVVAEAFAARSSQYVELESASQVWSFFVTPIIEAGYINLYGRDITAYKRAEAEIQKLNAELEERVIQRTTQLEAANRELEAFAYSVSHDLRAPLRGIDGWSHALLEDHYDRLDDQGRQYLDRVRAETQRMGRLIDDLLKLSRVTRAEMRQERVNLSALAQIIVTRLQESEPERAVEVRLQPDLTVVGDPALLEAALSNLLDNAFKFTRRCAAARIEFGQIELPGRRAFFVRDNGSGFDMAYSHKLFGAFQRMHKTSDFPGTGIGLATVQRIIHRHGGRVWAEAAVEQGATFYFTLEEAA